MTKLTLTFAALAAIVVMSGAATSADAAGFGWYASSGPVYSTYYTSPTIYTSGYGDFYHDDIYHGDVWHDTSHLHYRPSRFIRHGNHFHFEPGGYEVHRTGHWDHVHW